MSYTYGKNTFASCDALWDALNTALLAQGWTVYDSLATRSKVYRGPNVPNATFFPIVRATSDGATHIATTTYQDWDATAHSGIGATSATSGYVGGSGNYVLRVNPYSFALATDQEGAIYGGLYRRQVFRDDSGSKGTDGYGIVTAGKSAGATSLVLTSLNGHLNVGMKLPIWNWAHDSGSANKVAREIVTITSVSGTNIGVSALANDYDAGAVVGWDLVTVSAGTNGNLAPSGYFNNVEGSLWTGGDFASGATFCNIYGQGGPDGSAWQGSGYLSGIGFYPSANVTVDSSTASHGWVWGLAHHVIAVASAASSPKARYTKYTDGQNVYIQVSSGNGASSAFMQLLIGPTGDTPDFSTMVPMAVVPAPETDTLYIQADVVAPPAGGAPTNALNQGFN